MIIVMGSGATEHDVSRVAEHIRKTGLQVHISRGTERTIIGAIGDERRLSPEAIEVLPHVQRVVRILHPFKLASREFKNEPTVIRLPGGVQIGGGPGDPVTVIAGPCAVESEETLIETALTVRQAGAQILRGGAFKPRTSPYSFQGLGLRGLELLARAREVSGLPVVTEVLSPDDVPLVAKYADILQIGARSMQNFSLLNAVGRQDKPVLLKRGMMSTVEEWLMSAEYILANGNSQVILCERGIRTFETYTRNTMDVSAIPLVKKLTHLPVIADPSHGTGVRDLVPSLAKAAVAAGADGLIVEVHPNPEKALSDGPQSLHLQAFATLTDEVARVAVAVGRTFARPVQDPALAV